MNEHLDFVGVHDYRAFLRRHNGEGTFLSFDYRGQEGPRSGRLFLILDFRNFITQPGGAVS